MKGLMRKDWYIFLKYGKLFTLFVAAYALIGAFTKNALFFAAFSVIMGSMLVKMVMAYEEQDRWDCLAACLPLKPEQIVWEKYLLSLLSTGAIALLTAVSFWCAGIFSSGQDTFLSPLSIFLLLFLLGGLLISLELPIIFRFGVSRGRLFLTLMMMLAAGVLSAVMVGLMSSDGPGRVLFERGVIPAGVLMAGAAAVTAAVLAISVRISVAAYKKREF